MKKKKTLGRGLSSLFEKTDQNHDVLQQTPSSNHGYQSIAIDQITANPNQPRSFFDEDKLKELSQSIKSYGIIEPILLKPKTDGREGKYEIIAGERRLRAAKMIGLTEIPAIIKDSNNDDLLEVMLIENLQREDLSPLEEAQSYETIINQKKITQDQLSELIGKSRSHITNMIRILKAPLEVRKLLAENKLSMSQVRTIIGLDEQRMIELAEQAVIKKLSVRELEKTVMHFSNPSQKKRSKAKENAKDSHLVEVEEMYREKLKTKVEISPIKNKIGKIEIEYYDYDELTSLLERIQGIDDPHA